MFAIHPSQCLRRGSMWIFRIYDDKVSARMNTIANKGPMYIQYIKVKLKSQLNADTDRTLDIDICIHIKKMENKTKQK